MNHFTLLLALTSLGQSQTLPSAVVALHDGSRLNVTVADESLALATEFGALTIPVRKIRSIELGSHFHDENFPATLQAMGDANPKTRETATKAARAAGTAAFPFLSAAAKTHADPETKQRAAQLVSHLQGKYPPERLKADPDDVVVVDGMRLKGRLSVSSLKVRSGHLGELTVKLADIVEVRIKAAEGAKEVSVDASKDGWLDSGISVDRASKLVITAEGQVELWPQQPGQYVSTAKGFTMVGKGGVFNAGALIGRIGDGKPFLVGESYSGTPGEEGRLFLQVVGTNWGQPAVGSYTAKVTAE